ncbi:LANO_0E15808g1_1 [Lachancea nothofagi CBS 11611]|uniref:LANO_0E15808g1_1 n=1 Tax=Lachancea nothofagi CBS 11611 TaxID=1266666 RepID=A0A1G4K1C8_9SACH|nr:LANO_0E15808g1_1 [Lachancea nothofagi CBS 11611]
MAGRQLSYEELVHHIVSGTPVPNILHVPNVTLDASLSKESNIRPRAKPWEKPCTASIPEKASKESSAAVFPDQEYVQRSQSLESLSKYYSMETEFEQQMQRFLSENEGTNSSTVSRQL